MNIRTIVLLLLTLTAYSLSNSEYNYAYLLFWLATAALFVFALNQRIHIIFTSTFVIFAAATLLQLLYQYQHLPTMLLPFVPTTQFILSSLVTAACFAIGVTLACYCIHKYPHWTSSLLFPCLWVCYEYMVATYSTAGLNDSIANTQAHCLPLLQITTITGVFGISFLLLWLPISIAAACYYRQHPISTLTLVIPGLTLLLVLSFGIYRLHHMVPSQSVRLAMLAIPSNVAQLKTTSWPKIQPIISQYSNIIKTLTKQKPDVILLPEKIISTNKSIRQKLINQFVTLAKQTNTTLILGLNDKQKQRNTALIITPQQKNYEYYKQKLVSFSSEAAYSPGKQIGILPQNPQWGIAICHDLDFAQLARQYALADTKLLFLPALDFVVDAWQHTKPALLNSVANGYSMARAGQWGLLTLSDANGRLIQYKAASLNHVVTLIATISLGQGMTFYSQTGDWFVLVCLLTVLVLLGFHACRLLKTSNRRIS